MLVKCIIKVFLYLILAVMTLIHWLLNVSDFMSCHQIAHIS